MAPEARRVVVCDSDLQSVRALRFVLRGAGFGVDPTYTAEEALDRVAVRPPDAAIVELVLRDVLREGREVHLTPIEYQLLRVLILERGRLITHNELLRPVWGGVHLSDRRTLRTHIANLRRKVDPAGHLGLIRTFNGSGYRFEDPGSRQSPAALPRPRVPYLRAA